MKLQTTAFTLLLLACLPLRAEPIYKSVDDKGKVTYSNTPIKGGKKVDLPPISTVSLPKPPPKTEAAPTPKVDADKAQRKQQLQEAIAAAEKALQDAKLKAKEGDTPEFTRSTKTVTGKDGKPSSVTEIRDNPGAYEEKMKKLNAEVASREKQLADLKTELRHLDDKP